MKTVHWLLLMAVGSWLMIAANGFLRTGSSICQF